MPEQYDLLEDALRNTDFEEFKRHILGGDDGVARTPEWAAAICDVPHYTIKSLAWEWASKRTMLAAGARGGESSTCREAYGTEWARLMVLLQAMQGLGKPGVNILTPERMLSRNAPVMAPNSCLVEIAGWEE